MKKLLLLALLPAHLAFAQNPVTVGLQQFATGLPDVLDVTHAGDDRLFAVRQPGIINVVNADGTVRPTPFLDIQTRVNGGGEQGLLGLAFDPNYSTNGFFYVYYIFGAGNGNTRVSRFQVSSDPNVAIDTSEQVIYTYPQPYSNHNGGDLDFGPDGYLYIGLGDGGSGGDPQNHAQNLSDPLGDMLRIDVSDPDTTYTIPPSNPFATAGQDSLPEIWASGLRNPFRFGFDSETGDIWIGDVGQNAYEEVDFWPAGNNSHPNFGWRCREGLQPYNMAGCLSVSEYVEPVSEHGQSEFGWYSVIGGRVYRGQEFPRLQGRYIYTDYVGGQFYSLVPDGVGGWTREVLRNVSAQGYVCIAENNVGELFVCKINSGIIYRLIDPCPMAPPTISFEASTLSSTVADAYVWFLNGVLIPGATSQSYIPVANGTYTVRGTFGACQLISDPIVVLTVGVPTNEVSMFQVHPVPARDVVQLTHLPAASTLIRITDTAGRTVLEQPTGGAKEYMTVNVGELVPANYILSILGSAGEVIQRRMVSVAR